MKESRRKWLEAGFVAFAKNGPDALKIDQIARQVGKSRSGFYHNFVDLDDYVDALLEMFVEKAKEMKTESDQIHRFVPDYLEWTVRHKDHVFFSKQLFLNMQSNPKFQKAWDTVSAIAEDKTADLWMKMLGLSDMPKHKTQKFYETIRSATISRLDYDSTTVENLTALIDDVNKSFKFLLDS